MNHWDDVSAEDFKKDENLSLLVDVLGVAATKRIVEIFGGDSVYVPKAESVIRMVRDRRIYLDYRENRLHYRELAAKYNLTVRYIRRIIKEQRRSNSPIKERQLEIF